MMAEYLATAFSEEWVKNRSQKRFVDFAMGCLVLVALGPGVVDVHRARADELQGDDVQSGDVQSGEVSFSRDVLPVLSDRCFHCHGPDENHREAGLRLDIETAAKEDLGGYAAVVPGNLEDSELWRRIVSEDDDERMPPADSHRKPLAPKERDAIRRWILDGAHLAEALGIRETRSPERSRRLRPSDRCVCASKAC